MKSGRGRIKLAGFPFTIAAAALWVVCSAPVPGAVPPTRVLILFSDAPGLRAQDIIDRNLDRNLRATLQSGSEKCLSPGSVVRFMGVSILGMRQRLRRPGGRLEVDSNEQGTVVTSVVPVKQNSEARP